MKILHITGYYNEDLAYQENMLTRGQHELGNEVLVLTSNLLYDIPSLEGSRLKNIGETILDGITIIRTKAIIEIKKNSFVYFLNVLSNLKRISPDYIFIHDKGAYLPQIIWYKCFINKNVILRMDFHSDFTNSLNSRLGFVFHYFFKLFFQIFDFAFDKYYYIAPEMGKFARKIYSLNENKLELLRLPGDPTYVNSLSKKFLRKKWNIQSSDFVILHSGKLPEGKKTIELIKSIKGTSNILLICGSISENMEGQRLHKLICDTSNVTYLGWKNSNELRELIKACDVLVQPGTLSNTFIEAVCIGTPLILGESMQAEDLLVNKKLMIKGKITPKKISNKIEHLKSNIEFYANESIKNKKKFHYLTIAKQSIRL